MESKSSLLLYLTTLIFLSSLSISSSLQFTHAAQMLDPTMPQPDMLGSVFQTDPSITHDYSRFSQVQTECGSILSSSVDLQFDPNRMHGLKPQLSFLKGDWSQNYGNAPLMPFDKSGVKPDSNLPDPLPLSTFLLTHIDLTTHSRTALNVSGALGIGISENGTAPEMGRYLSPEFKFFKGSSDLTIIFEGVYTETETEMVLCLLGNANLPTRDSNSANPWIKWMKSSQTTSSMLSQDEMVLLTVRYPKSFTLTNRAVQGELKSLNPKSSEKYFDPVKLSSQLGAYSNYEFGSEDLVSTACVPYPYRDDSIQNQLEVYKGSSFCGFLDRFVSDEVFHIVPNSKCSDSNNYCKKLGPFKTKILTNSVFAGVSIIMQDIRCEPSVGSARVSAVFRAVLPRENRYVAARRTGLAGTTLSSEGVWNSSSGQLCMVGCLGLSQTDCGSRVCLYLPTAFSIAQRNLIIGEITSISKEKKDLHFPLSFERRAHPSELWTKFTTSQVTSYKYTKIKQAGAFLERNEPFDFGDVIAKSLLSYPRKGDGRDELASLSNLADDLTLHVSAIPEPRPITRMKRPFMQLEILSLGSLIGRYKNVSGPGTGTEGFKPVPVTTEAHLLLNVSGELTISGDLYKNISVLNLEGIYNPIDGKMYLIACRDMIASSQVLSDSTDLDAGKDCLIEVKVEYPPTTARWLMNPTARISVTSKRNEDDLLYFNTTNFQTLPILYRAQREDILSRRSVEGILRVLTLTLAIVGISSQLFYIRGKNTIIPYVSLVMLGVQALGYSIPLITGAEALFEKITQEKDTDLPSYKIEKNQWYWAMDYLVKVLVMAAFLLTLRLAQKAWKSRIRMLTRSPLEQWRVPNDKKVFLYCLGIHSLGFVIALLVHLINVSRRPGHQEEYLDSKGKSHKLHDLGIQLEEYIGLVQDFFLLPQIIGNYLWKIECKPLRKSYYIGLTLVRLFPHAYDCVRAPVINPYFGEEYEFVNTSSDFFSKFGDVMIPLISILFMVAVYVQQRWNYEKITSTVKSGQKKLLSMGSRVYERLPSMSSFEAELVVSAVKEAEFQEILRKDATAQIMDEIEEKL
ncbi:hypothetical protein LUZ60_009656 [Juncus effusus]|nr:hypothetical protein LUZ60_009656 [Juncus effusus]